MFYIINIDRQAVLTYRDGARMMYTNKSIAEDRANLAETLSNAKHAIQAAGNVNIDAMQRMVAPWLK